MKRPDFLQGVTAGAQPSPPKLRSVAWKPAPSAPVQPARFEAVTPAPPPPLAAVPELKVVAPPAPPVVAAPAVPVVNEAQRQSVKLAIEALKAQSERLAEQARSDSLELGVLIARRILEREIASDLGAIFSLIKSAIRKAGEEHVTRVRLHPEDVSAFAVSAESEFSFGKIELIGDATLSRGDVMVDTAHHTLDGRLSTRMEEIVRQLS